MRDESKLITANSDWTPEILEQFFSEIERIATEYIGLEAYPNQIEIISSDMMLDAYSTVALPIMYPHWSFGKQFVSEAYAYKKGHMGLAYEVVLNSNPCIAYCMEENTTMMQALVMAHACFGHNCFSDDTEILTSEGWKGMNQISDTEVIATMNRDNARIEYKQITKKFVYDYKGTMCHFKNSTSDHLVTPNHKMIYGHSFNNKVYETTADKWSQTGTYAFVSGYSDVPDNTQYTDDELRLLAWCITDGHLNYKPTHAWYWRLKKERKITRLIALFDRLNISYTHTTLNYDVDVHQISTHLSEKYYKLLSSDFMLSPRQTVVFLTEWMHTDGSFQTSTIDKNGSLYTNVKLHADKIQELATLSGIKSSYKIQKNNVYHISIRFDKTKVQLSRSPLTSMMEYEGKVWCVDVPNHTIVSRRNGRILITGNSYFKNNYLFKQWTDAEAIIDYLVFAKKYVQDCEEKYGAREVERVLDACHALMNYGVDKYSKPDRLSISEERDRQDQRLEYAQQQTNDLWRTIPGYKKEEVPLIKFGERNKKLTTLEEPQENILYFLEKNAPNLETWHREIIRIVRKISQYFYPQRQTQLGNEGFATWTHHTIMNKLYDEGLINEGFMLEFIESHTGVVAQRPFDSKYYSGINPYALGFAMYKDIERISTDPTDEDKEWFSHQDWVGNNKPFDNVKWAAYNFKDESFVRQFLSPKVIRDFKLFTLLDDQDAEEYVVTGIHNKEGYKYIRETLANQYTLVLNEPNIQITHVHFKGDRSLYLSHQVQDGRLLDEKDVIQVLNHIGALWQFDVILDSVVDDTDRGTNSLASYAVRDGQPVIEYFMEDQ